MSHAMTQDSKAPALHRVTSARTGGFYQKLIFQALERLPLSALRMVLPDGTERIFGTGETVAAEIRVNDMAFFRKIVLFGDVGFGEAYVDRDWDSPDVAAVLSWFLLNTEHWPTISGSKARSGLLNLFRAYNRVLHLLRDNTVTGSRKNISAHYDLSNDFFKTFLDPTMTYSAAAFERSEQSLEEAQTAKYDKLCRKLQLKPTDHVLEIGGGWGGFSRHAATQYGCHVTTLTVSKEQHRYAAELFQKNGLSNRVQVRLMDYRHAQGRFDKIVSIEMLEAVGDRHLETYFAKCHQLLKKDGLLGMQFIICPDARYKALNRGVDWIQKHIFPGSLLLSVPRVNQAINRTGDLFLHHLEDLGQSYARTLELWHERFNQNMDQVGAMGFDSTFIRKWNYYLQYCEAAFAMHNISVVQAVYTRPNNPLIARGL